jgi:hypothetical protein
MSTCADRLLSRRPVVIALLLGWLLTAFAPPARAAGDCYSEYTWRQGQAKQQMMSDSEGTCVLTKVGGHFEGGRERGARLS